MIGYKKVVRRGKEYVLAIFILPTARVVMSKSKCRAEFCMPFDAWTLSKKPVDYLQFLPLKKKKSGTIYKLYQWIAAHKFSDNPKVVNASGIHFFRTFDEAVRYR